MKTSYYEGLILRNDKLFIRRWVPDKNENGEYIEIDVSSKLPEFLCSNIIIEQGTTVRDFFKLLNNHRAILGIIQKRNNILEYLDYCLNNTYDGEERMTDYVEVYFTMEHRIPELLDKEIFVEVGREGSDEIEKHVLYSAGETVEEETFFNVGFHGLSKPLTEKELEEYHMDKGQYKPGEYRLPLSYYGCDATEFMDVPLKISGRIDFIEIKYSEEKCRDVKYFRKFNNITLIQLIDAIFCEISIFGNPEESLKIKKEHNHED